MRTEIIHRHNNIYQLYAVAGVLCVWVLSNKTMSAWFLITIGVCIIAFCILLWSLFIDMFNAAERIKEIENSVNKLAGEKLLVWEREWGGSVWGFWGRARVERDLIRKGRSYSVAKRGRVARIIGRLYSLLGFGGLGSVRPGDDQREANNSEPKDVS